MSSYYVSVGRGDDTTGNGTATTPWKTIAKAIGASPAITLSGTGDTLYIEPGVYREAVPLALAPASSGGRLTIVGDSDGAGFLAGGYSTPATGLVDWRAWTDDNTTGSGSPSGICLSASSKNYVTLRSLKMIGGTTGGGGSSVQLVTCNGWTIQDCNLIGHYAAGNAIYVSATAGVALNLTLDRCNIRALCPSSAAGLWLLIPKAGADWSLGVAITNCYFSGAGEGIDTRSTGSGSFIGGGVAIQNCTFDSLSRAVNAYVGAAMVPASPTTIRGCLVVGGSGLAASTVGQVDEDGNMLLCVSQRTNVATGTNSNVTACPSLDFGDSRLTGLPPRPYGCPSAVGVIGGFGNYGTVPSVDMLGRNRPEGFGATAAAAGCLERHDTGAQDATYQDSGSAACMALVGPSSQDRPVLLAAASTTISVKVRWDGNHGDTNKPQAILLPNPEIGFAGQTVTATSTGGSGSTPNSFETLTFTAFTPSKVGVVMLRMVSRAGAGNGVAYFDTIGIA